MSFLRLFSLLLIIAACFPRPAQATRLKDQQLVGNFQFLIENGDDTPIAFGLVEEPKGGYIECSDEGPLKSIQLYATHEVVAEGKTRASTSMHFDSIFIQLTGNPGRIQCQWDFTGFHSFLPLILK